MAQVKLIDSLEDFLDVLEKSRLFSPEHVQQFRKELAGSSKQPVEIARTLVKNRKISKWQATQLLSGYHRFRQGQFVLRDQLGKDRLGSVLLAYDEKRSQLVVLRPLSKSATAKPDAVNEFLKAVDAAMKLEHDHVARVLEVKSDSGRHTVISEFVKGEDLQQKVSVSGPLPVPQAVKRLREAATAIAWAHQHDVIHGHLHPECFRIGASDGLKISGWGLAPLCDPPQEFSAPEQRAGEPPTPRSDIYSLGATLYYLLSGRVPSASDASAGDLTGEPSEAAAVSLGELAPEAPGALIDLCASMMAPDPDQRPATMAEVLARIASGDAANAGAVATGVAGTEGADDVEAELESLDAVELVEAELEADDAATAATVDEPEVAGDVPPSGEPSAAAEESAASGEKVAEEPPLVAAADAPVVVPPKPPADPGVSNPAAQLDLGDAEKKVAVSDPAAIAISTGKEVSAGPVGAFKISTKRKKKKKKSKEAAKSQPAAAAVAAKTSTASDTSSAGRGAAATKQKSPTKPSAATAAASPAEADGPTDPPAAADAKKQKKSVLPLVLIIGAAALFGLTLLGGGTLLIVFMLSGADDVVASAGDTVTAVVEGESAPAADEPEIDPEDIPDEIVLVQDDPEPADNAEIPAGPPADSIASADPTAESVDAGEPNVGAAAAVEPVTPADAAANPAAVAVAPAPTNAASSPADPVDDEAKKRAEADATAKKKAEPQPDPEMERADAQKKKAEEEKKKAEEQKRKADEEQKKKAAAGPVFVFKPTIDLPELSSADAASKPLPLGKINIGADDVCFISMTGGETAARGRAEFSIRNANSGTAPRDWEFVLTEDSTETVIATMALPETELLFQWLPVAVENQNAGNLRNCSLKITAGSAKPQLLALRSPVIGESIQVDLTKSSLQARWNVDSPPDPSTMQVIASMKGQKMVLEPPQPISAMKGEQWIYLGENKSTTVLALKLESTVNARGIQVTLKPYLTIPGEKPLAYNKGTKKRVEQQLAQRGQLQAKVAFLQEQLKKAPAPQKPQVEIAVTQAQQGLEAFDKMAQQVSQLDQIEQSYSTAVLDFEVIYRTLQDQIVLLKTQAGGGS